MSTTGAIVTPDEQARAYHFVLAAKKAREAADAFDNASDLLKEGKTELSYIAGKKGRDLVEDLFPKEVKMPRRPEPSKTDEAVESLKTGFAYGKMILPGLALIGLLLWLVLSGTTGNIAGSYENMTPEQATKAAAYPKK